MDGFESEMLAISQFGLRSSSQLGLFVFTSREAARTRDDSSFTVVSPPTNRFSLYPSPNEAARYECSAIPCLFPFDALNI